MNEITHGAIGAIILLMIMLTISIGGYTYYGYPSGDTWCERNKPQLNISSLDPKVAYCYGKGWENYSKISYPEDCPKS